MPGEPILIVDDTPVNLKLTRILLVNEGYKVMTAGSGEEALELLSNFHPKLVLADIQLPGIDGLELTRRLKSDDNTRDIPIIALTAYAMNGDEQKAIDAGCDGYITKPIDTRTLGARIREFLGRAEETQSGPAAPPVGSHEAELPAAELHALRRRFLEEGREQTRGWLKDLDGRFIPAEAARTIHQWIGAAGLLGYTAVTRLAREVEAVLNDRPLDQNQLREALGTLALSFSSPRDARDAPVPEPVQRLLRDKTIAMVGLPAAEQQRLAVALERAGALPLVYQPFDLPESGSASPYDAVVLHLLHDTAACSWLNASVAERAPLILIGSREDLLALDPKVQALADGFLMDAWQADEALVRLSLAIQWRGNAALRTATPGPRETAVARPRVVIADDDPTVLALVGAALQNFGMEIRTVSEGVSAVTLIREYEPHAVVLDINMPGMDGFEVLATIRQEGIPVRVLLLTARQQESDVLRGFTLGADDYVTKPFNPPELVARLKRLLRR